MFSLEGASFCDPTRNAATIPMMKITAYEDPKQNKKKDSLILPYDESTLDINFKNASYTRNIIGQASGQTRFINAYPTCLQVTFVLDDTTFSNMIAYAMPRKAIPGSVDKKNKKVSENMLQN